MRHTNAAKHMSMCTGPSPVIYAKSRIPHNNTYAVHCQRARSLDIVYIHRCNNITREANLSMRFIFLCGHCCLTSVEALIVCINISPSLAKKLPDRNQPTCIEALCDERSSLRVNTLLTNPFSRHVIVTT